MATSVPLRPPRVVRAVEVQVGQSARVDVDLKLGALTESMVVAAGTPLLDTESGTPR